MRRAPARALALSAILALSLAARAASAAPAAPGPAAGLFAKAEEQFSALRSDTKAQRQRQNFTRVLDAYRKVFDNYPATRQGEESLLRAGELQILLFRWTGQEADLNRAQNYYQRLVQGAPKSPLADDALLAIAILYRDHFKDPAQAWLRFREVTKLAPGGDKAPEAKRQLKRLVNYAVPDKPAPPGGSAELSCPAPQPLPPRQTVIASPPPAAVIGAPAPPEISMPPKGDSPPAGPTAAPAGTSPPPALNRVRGIRHWSNPEYSRVVIDLERQTNFYSNLLDDRAGSGQPPRLYLDLFSSSVEERFCKPIAVNDGILHGVRAGQYTPDTVRVVLEIDGLRTYRVFPMQNPFRIVVDVTGGEPGAAPAGAVEPVHLPPTPETALPPPPPPPLPLSPPPAPSPPAPAAARGPRTVRLEPAPRYTPEPVPELIPLPSIAAAQPEGAGSGAAPSPAPVAAANPVTFSGTAGDRAAPAAAPARATPTPVRGRPAAGRPAAGPTAAGKPSLARQLGLGVRRIVVDAGHGAHDPGAIGIGGLQEKDVTLDLALRVRDILHEAGYETVLTRDRDVYLPLEERTAIANTARGDLFISLHCNSSDAGNLSGVETYFLNLASNLRSMQTAARENSMAVANMSDLQQIVREIQNSKMDESSRFAAKIQRSMHDALRRKHRDVKDLGVKQAPFYVLIGAQMPSVLAEVSFINHRTEGKRLADPAYRQLLAQALVDGIKRYVRTVKTAAAAAP